MQHAEQPWQAARLARIRPFFMPSSSRSWLSQQNDADSVTYQLQVPGYRRRDLTIEVRKRVVTVRGTQTEGWLKPRSKKSFVCSFSLPDALDEGDVSATLTRGLLQLTIGKKPHARRRHIPIRVRSAGARPLHGPTESPWRRLLAWLRKGARGGAALTAESAAESGS